MPRLRKVNSGASSRPRTKSQIRSLEKPSKFSAKRGGVWVKSYRRFNKRAANAPCCPATCAVCGIAVPGSLGFVCIQAASPMTRMEPELSRECVGTRSHRSTLTRPPTPAASSGSLDNNSLTKGAGSFPAPHTDNPHGTVSSTVSVPFSLRRINFLPTSVKRVFSRTSIPALVSAARASSRSSSSNIGRSSGPPCTSMTATSSFKRPYAPLRGLQICFKKSLISPASSTPVGPPPMMTKRTRLRRSAILARSLPRTSGREANSKASPIAVRKSLESCVVFRLKQYFWAPGTILLRTCVPTAAIR
mmetsp:Transcript_20203/g.38284  ORF Transcript_20203/g.38284 Transcript_20203/m.38284 type:complete len:304 (+) Transcript_20203:315-1226(+)